VPGSYSSALARGWLSLPPAMSTLPLPNSVAVCCPLSTVMSPVGVVDASVMFPPRGSHQHGPALLGRVRVPPVPRRLRSYWALRLPALLRALAPVPLARAYLNRLRFFFARGRVRTLTRLRRDGSPAPVAPVVLGEGEAGPPRFLVHPLGYVPWSNTPPYATGPRLLPDRRGRAFCYRGGTSRRDPTDYRAFFERRSHGHQRICRLVG
jgi:hypothetical protein